MRVNLVRDFLSRPVLSSLLAAACLVALALVVALLAGALARHADTLSAWLTDHAAVSGAAVFLLCLASQVPPTRRELDQARSGWLSALPQMPRAMHRWSRRRRWGLAALESLGLALAVAAVYRHAAPEVTSTPVAWLVPVGAPVLAALLAPGLARRGRGSARSSVSRAPAVSRARDSVPILTYWQWVHYRSCCWRAGMRWSLGFLIILMPAGASALQVGIALVIGLFFLQLIQLWSSTLQVIFQASRLVRALPVAPWAFIRQVSGLPLMTALAVMLAAVLVLAAVGLSFPGAVVAGLGLFGVLSLNLATALAWRHEARFAGLRSAAVLLVWLTFSQSAPFMAPVGWCVLIAWLLRRAGREVS